MKRSFCDICNLEIKDGYEARDGSLAAISGSLYVWWRITGKSTAQSADAHLVCLEDLLIDEIKKRRESKP